MNSFSDSTICLDRLRLAMHASSHHKLMHPWSCLIYIPFFPICSEAASDEGAFHTQRCASCQWQGSHRSRDPSTNNPPLHFLDQKALGCTIVFTNWSRFWNLKRYLPNIAMNSFTYVDIEKMEWWETSLEHVCKLHLWSRFQPALRLQTPAGRVTILQCT